MRIFKKVKDDSVKDANDYIYLFPDEPAMGDYKKECKQFGLTYVGKNRYQGEKNLVIKGSLSNLKRYAKYLAYDLHPDYLYKEDEFAGDITRDSVEDSIDKNNVIYDEYKIGDIIITNSGQKILIKNVDKDDNGRPIYWLIDYNTNTKIGWRHLNGNKIEKNSIKDSCKDASKYIIRYKEQGDNDYQETEVNSLKEFKDRIALSGIGTHYCWIMTIKKDGNKIFMGPKRLDELNENLLQDSCKDETPYEEADKGLREELENETRDSIKDEKQVKVDLNSFLEFTNTEEEKRLLKKYFPSGWYTKSKYNAAIRKMKNEAKEYETKYTLSYYLSFDEFYEEQVHTGEIKDASIEQEEKLHNYLERDWTYLGKKGKEQVWQYTKPGYFPEKVKSLRSIANDLISYVDILDKKVYIKEDVKYDDSYEDSCKDELVNVPNNIKKEFEKVLTSGNVFKIVSQSPNMFTDTHYQIITNKQYEENEWKKPVDFLISKIEAFENKYHQAGSRHSDIPVTWSFGYQKDKYISAGIDVDKMWVDTKKDSKGVKDSMDVNKANKLINVVKKVKDVKVKDYDERILNALKQVAQKGEKIKNDYNKFLNIYNQYNDYHSWQQLKKENLQKASMIEKNKENWKKQIDDLAKEWDKYIDILNRNNDKLGGNFNTLYNNIGSMLPTMDEYNRILKRIDNLQSSKGKSPFNFDSVETKTVKDSVANKIFSDIKKIYPRTKFKILSYKDMKDRESIKDGPKIYFSFDAYIDFRDLPSDFDVTKFSHWTRTPMEKNVINIMEKHGFEDPNVFANIDEEDKKIEITSMADALKANLK